MNSEVRRSAESRRGVEVLEDGVGIGAEIGPERIFLGLDGAFVTMAQELLSAAWVKDF